MGRFHTSLEELKAGRRGDHVRIVWLGDSHTAADLWTGAVRRALQAQYGDGGPGFVHAGWARYRHEKAKTEVSGSWRVEPGDYARSKRYDDGVQGLGGVRQVPKEPGGSATIEVRGGEGPYTWDVAYRLPAGAALQASIGGGEPVRLKGQGETVQHHGLSSASGPHRLRLAVESGRPQLLGVVVEAKKPGVILDTVGLNGARVATFLGWEQASWEGELRRRKPDLVVLAFGTNETSDPAPEAERYELQIRKLMERVDAAAPGADCLVITPMDRAGPEFASRINVISEGFRRAAKTARCAVWDAQSAMGGAGSMAAWAAESPARGGGDGIHLTARGYASLGEMLARDLIPAVGSGGGLPPGGKAP